ncbi:ATP-binding protein [Devosia sp.]|uniref:ATP-binding protein n=1 Tax=Devosia sp. TaxID=1871048 RepID=UPI00292F9789|nr:ATP-binding protein [Devosia sp.]
MDEAAKDVEPNLALRIAASATTGEAATGSLKTDDRIIARVTDGIYREPWSAFRELISNAYDADATSVSIDCDYPFFKEIRITDNGNGMNRDTVAHLLEHIGGSSKRTSQGRTLGTVKHDDPTLSPGGRRLIGKIGIGLFAVAQLTQHFQIITKRRGEADRVSATILLDTYRENTLGDEGETYSSGSYSVISEKTLDVESHGTTIILMQIRPAIRKKLQSAEIWGAIEDQETDPDVGKLEIITPPTFHIGKISDSGELVSDANLPWSKETSEPLARFRALYEAAVRTDRTAREQANLAHFDNYLKMIWRLGLASPLPYINLDPFDLTGGAGVEVYRLANSKKGACEHVPIGQGESVRETLGVSADANEKFSIFIDGIELRRPIDLPTSLVLKSQHSSPLLFVGQVDAKFSRAAERRSGGELRFDAYLYWNSKIVPKESIGALVRVNGASGTLFDPEFMNYQVSEQTRKKQITCEIFVHKGLDGALNIDRESFNTSHPHYLYIQQWLHSAFRQFANEHKRLGRAASARTRVVRETEFASQLNRYTEMVWEKVRGSEFTPPDFSQSNDDSGGVQAQVGGHSVYWPPEKLVDQSGNRSKLIEAVSVILEAYGVLDRLDDDARGELIFDLVAVLERAA